MCRLYRVVKLSFLLVLMYCSSSNAANILFVGTYSGVTNGSPSINGENAQGATIIEGGMSQLLAIPNTTTTGCATDSHAGAPINNLPDVTSAITPATNTIHCFPGELIQLAVPTDFYTKSPDNVPYDMIIVMSVFGSVEINQWNAISDSAVNNPGVPIILFRDACGNCNLNGGIGGGGPAVTTQIAALFKSLNPNSPISTGAYDSTAGNFNLNQNSAFFTPSNYASFINGVAFTPFTTVPKDNILYYSDGASTITDTSTAYSVILPASQSLGACLFATVDASEFQLPYRANNPTTMSDFVGGATRVGSSCAAISPIQLTEKVTNNNGKTSFQAGDTLTYTIIITNTSATPYSTETIYDSIPAQTTYVAGSITTSDSANFPTNDTDTSNLVWGGATSTLAGNGTYTFTYQVTVDANISVSKISNQSSEYYNNFSQDVTGVLGSKGVKGQTIISAPMAPIATAAIPTVNILSLLVLFSLLTIISIYFIIVSYKTTNR